MTDPADLPFAVLTPPADLRDEVMSALAEQDLHPELGDQGMISVQVEGQHLYVVLVDSQPPLLRVFGHWRIDESQGGDLVRLRAANALTGALNLIKATVHGDRLAVAVDLVLSPGLPLGPLLSASVDAVLGSVHAWQRTVAELLGQPG